ncbi:DUF58 domain-containing protein [Blautia sp. MSJ-19]|uniref:DUF58 domain-containing protein n=1 Tax=Blautia sp. MSJ-19 TaxID=2841517 RepID=UPI001C0F089C|nr:DUF58 domain-containing protein [Blautia sp. MSJ-19]MBU5482289.1 DUF58 domain-containing protein [Blautia sp. MSJ-19]
MKSKILYLLFLLITLWVAVSGRNSFAYFLLIGAVLFAFCMAIGVHDTAKRIQVQAETERTAIIRGEQGRFFLHIENQSIFPVGDIRITLEVSGVGRIVRHSGADRKSRDSWQIFLEPVHCGFVRIRVVEMRVFDYLGLFSAKIRIPKLARTISVLPKIQEIDAEALTDLKSTKETEQEAVTAAVGTDSQEIFDTRVYHQGDMLKNIHWKLSAKEDELMVREFSMPEGSMLCVFLDTSNEGKEPGADQMDAFLDQAASLGNYLLEKQQDFEYVWFEKGRKDALRIQVTDREGFGQALEGILGICQGTAETGAISEEYAIRIGMDGQIRQDFPESKGTI